MQKTDGGIDQLDLRSLRMLKLLLDTRSVTRAGEALGISQPAASRVLAQLRDILDDPLLVRGRQGSTLTPRAESLASLVEEALHAVATLFARETFEPTSATVTLRVATTDHGAAAVLVPLVQRLATLAPKITVNVAPWSDQTLHDLETGKLDLALDAESDLPENFHFRALFKDRYACLVRRNHPVLKSLRRDGSLNPKAAAPYPQIILLYPVGNQLKGDDVLALLGHPAERIAMKTPYFTSAPLLLSGTDNMILLPARLGETLTRLAPLAMVPLHADTQFGYRLIWHERTQRNLGMSWLRAQIYELFSGIGSADK
jgi:DNA-binding transcriptional LysR family regulator